MAWTALESSAYLSPKIFKQEQDSIFYRTFQYCGSSEWLKEKGDYFTYRLCEEPLLVLKEDEQQLSALSNVCRHRASKILERQGNTKNIQCPYHGWTYELSGALRKATDFGGDPGSQCLPQFTLKNIGPLLFVNLDSSSDTWARSGQLIQKYLEAEQISLDNYQFLCRRDYLVDCNWKVYIDNYLEGYHIPLVHPALYRLLDYKNYRTRCEDGLAEQLSPLKNDTEKAFYYWLYPNFMINVYPDNMSTNLVLPVSADKTHVIFEWFVTAPVNQTVDFKPLDCLQLTPYPVDPPEARFSHQVQKEDITVCEKVQKGIRSRFYSPGPLSPKHENGVAHFHSLWRQSVGAPLGKGNNL